MHAVFMHNACVYKHVHIRDLKATVHERLTENASAMGLSLSQYLRIELENLAMRPKQMDVFQRLRNLPRKNVGTIDTSELLQNLRDARTRQNLGGFNEP